MRWRRRRVWLEQHKRPTRDRPAGAPDPGAPGPHCWGLSGASTSPAIDGATGPPRSGSQSSSLELVLFTVASAHLLAMEAHEGQVVEHGGDYYLHRLVPLAEAARPYGALAEMAAVLHRVIEDTRDHPDVTRRYDTDRLRALEVPEEVVRAIDAVTQRPGERFLGGVIQRSAADRLGRLIALLDNKRDLDETLNLARTDPDRARSLREGCYLPARRILLKAEAADVHRILA
jgi:hypothetical protein